MDGGRWDWRPSTPAPRACAARLIWAATTPAGWRGAFQLASGPNQLQRARPFVGPDGTDATWYTASGTPAAYAHDGDRWVRTRAELSTTDPWVTPRSRPSPLGTDLGTFGEGPRHPSTIPVTAPAGCADGGLVGPHPHRRRQLRRQHTAAIRAAGPPVVPGVGGHGGLRPPQRRPGGRGRGEVVTQPTGTPIAFDGATLHSIVWR